MATVTYEHVTKHFGEVVAVEDLNLHVEDGEFLVLLGPSGCGKTTTLRLLAGLEEPTSGNLYIGGRLVNDIPPKDRDIAMVFQSYALYPHMNVYDNMAFGLKLRKTPKDEIDRRVHEAAKILGIEDLLDRKPKQLSGGQRQRVAVGRAIVREPKVFLMDEPLSNLDAKLRVHARAELSKLHRRLGTTWIYVTHDQVEAMTMGTRIAVMNKGILQQVGEPQKLYKYPKNLFVAGFIGSPAMNFFDVTLVSEDGELYARGDAFKVQIPPVKREALLAHGKKEIILGIRPQDIYSPRFVPPEVNEAPIKARVEVIEPMGDEIHLHLLTGTRSFVAVVDPRTEVSLGQEIEAIANADNFHFFDPETEEAIR